MLRTALRVSAHSLDSLSASSSSSLQQFCRCGSPLLVQSAASSGRSSSNGSRRSFASSSRWRQLEQQPSSSSSSLASSLNIAGTPPLAAVEAGTGTTKATSKPARREFKAAKAAIHLTPTAVEQLSALLDSPTPKLIRIGVRNKGCAGMAYHLEYVEKSGKFDEVVKQDGVSVLIDSKALFSIVGSEMDWQEDKISAKFVFNNPNIKEQCGCGESFMT